MINRGSVWAVWAVGYSTVGSGPWQDQLAFSIMCGPSLAVFLSNLHTKRKQVENFKQITQRDPLLRSRSTRLLTAIYHSQMGANHTGSASPNTWPSRIVFLPVKALEITRSWLITVMEIYQNPPPSYGNLNGGLGLTILITIKMMGAHKNHIHRGKRDLKLFIPVGWLLYVSPPPEATPLAAICSDARPPG